MQHVTFEDRAATVTQAVRMVERFMGQRFTGEHYCARIPAVVCGTETGPAIITLVDGEVTMRTLDTDATIGTIALALDRAAA